MNAQTFLVLLAIGACFMIAKPVISGFVAGLNGVSDEQICPACGTTGRGQKVTRGSFAIEVVLWICYIIPGLIYSLWRMSSTTWNSCPSCHLTGMIPLDSPRGKQLAAEFAPSKAE